MKLELEPDSSIPVFQQIIDQVHFKINTGDLKTGEKLPSIRNLASKYELATNTVAKAMRQLEFRGLIISQDRSGFRVADNGDKVADNASRYNARGVPRTKLKSITWWTIWITVYLVMLFAKLQKTI